jgi:LPXTG-site transpeptidase (sortase) family protein
VSAALVLVIIVTVSYAYRWYATGELPPFIAVKALVADPRVDESPVSAAQIKQHSVPANHPRYISIEKLGVHNARVFSAGVNSDNVLKSPDNISDATWYDKSATPGSGGAVLIDAHNGGITRNGIFANLNTLTQGDLIVIERGDGKTYTYAVVENQSMPLEEVNKTGMKMMLQTVKKGIEGLNLITCDGKWVPRYQQFDRRIMLRAVRLE